MAKKGVEKNTRNKTLHTKLLKKKSEKLRKEKEAHKAKLKAIYDKAKATKEKPGSTSTDSNTD